jgi:hypothetical protein
MVIVLAMTKDIPDQPVKKTTDISTMNGFFHGVVAAPHCRRDSVRFGIFGSIAPNYRSAECQVSHLVNVNVRIALKVTMLRLCGLAQTLNSIKRVGRPI